MPKNNDKQNRLYIVWREGQKDEKKKIVGQQP